MVYSMTGFATGTYDLHPSAQSTVHATMTVRTLNSKFSEVTCRLPHVLAPLEQIITQRCKEQFKRGNITVIIHISNPAALRSEVIPALHLAHDYVRAAKAIQVACDLPGEITIQHILSMPALFETADAPLTDAVMQEFFTCFNELLDMVLIARATEGAALQKDLESAIQIIQTNVEQLAPRAEEISQQRRERFLQDIQSCLATTNEEVRTTHIQALYQHINAIDTHEEIIRMRTHCINFLDTLHNTEVLKGKRLDFILQELFREINTLNAKLADSASIDAILTIKTKLEHAREQVQNLV